MRMYMCALPPGQLIFICLLAALLSTLELPNYSSLGSKYNRCTATKVALCLTPHRNRKLLYVKKKRFCLLLYESLSAHMFMLKAKYAIDSYETLVPLHVMWAIDSHTWQSTHLHQTKLLSEIAIVFFFLYIHASDLLCNVHLTRRRWTRFASNPFLLSLSLFLVLSKSVNLFPNCKLNAGERAFFHCWGEILNQCTLPYIEWALIFI